MITTHGIVSIKGTPDTLGRDIYVENFCFEGVDFVQARVEALQWAKQKIDAALLEAESGRPSDAA